MHSPWGSRGEICKAYGWTYEYLLWGISWLNVNLMMADAARINTDEIEKTTDDEVVEVQLKTKQDLKKFITGD